MSDPKLEIDELVAAVIDGRLSSDQTGRLESLLAQSPQAVTRYIELLDNHEALCAIYPGDVFTSNIPVEIAPMQTEPSMATVRRLLSLPLLGLAASVLLAVGFAGYFFGSDASPSQQAQSDPSSEEEQIIAGHAMLRRSVDVRWSDDAVAYRDGDMLPGGTLKFDQGVAELDFFCGATVTVEGPASLEIESDWSVKVVQGRLRANVPPAARGFVVKAADSEIVDLGTEFAVEVESATAQVEVIDGEVALRGGQHDGTHLTTGQRQSLGSASSQSMIANISGPAELQRRRTDAESQHFDQWKTASRALREDTRLIAYFPIADSLQDRSVPNMAGTADFRDGTLVGPVVSTEGRFGTDSEGLDFERIGARVRTRIDGEFAAFTFATWVRIDSLEHRYNSLFMSDGYENGEPHWQIRDDGRLMFSVMVDDSAEVLVKNAFDKATVRDRGLHRIYITDPVWDISKSGRWFHLASVYDPANRRVTQYCNGEQVSDEAIADKFFVDRLRIGPAEIGNWGQPFRDSPWFAVRNLNGTIDELAVFDAALNANEVLKLFEQGKPLGY
ncbi:FecR protein [Rubripirellula tenax]|uniref:FecR protein n=1 Tax=Rubripirellula tenax TaxID=2528015 RepID=A0A5C6F6V6_9BACT|nr:LamG-like jellyroll fold domain-containing protein [Rubripirellula tenax]TWU56682.1 FecR protein [Rubripirellula tenax]